MINVVGIRHIDYVNKSGRRIQGIKVFYTCEEHNTQGLSTGDAYIPYGCLIPQEFPELPFTAELYYDRYGKVISFNII